MENDGDLSAEYVIRNKRYTKEEMCSLLIKTGFDILEVRYVRAGRWDTPLDARHKNAKEILVFAKKRRFLDFHN